MRVSRRLKRLAKRRVVRWFPRASGWTFSKHLGRLISSQGHLFSMWRRAGAA